MKREIIIAPSILSADFSNLKSEIARVEKAGAKYLHFDVMDGHFVKNISFGVVVLKSISKIHSLINDVHLMIENVEDYVDSFIDAGADIITFHIEAVKKVLVMDLIDKIHSRGVKVGISIKPGTSYKDILEYLPYIDLVLVMSVEPGFGGQKFMDLSLNKISSLHSYINENNLNVLLEVDGGINDVTSKKTIAAGVDILVAGSYLFGHDDIKERINKLLK